ncbi:MGMT family protein [Marinicrinis lubricantis]|uniref:MGMT family protein n=1 Tax=Marinicrinis lubricantis TaxID=2086470 RepID=A0ABW1INT6_9BACL
MTPFTLRAIEIIKGIPKGSVMTYGQIAALAGNHRGARQVVRILHSSSKAYALPWFRVVNARGEIALKDDIARSEQASYLRDEGIEVSDTGKIDLERYLYIP